MTAGGYVFPRARTRDPVTSHLAAAQVTTAESHYQAIYDALTGWGPMGKDEIAALAGLDPSQVARRLPEMRRLGLVGLTGETVQSRSGRQEREWQAITQQEKTA
jgi:predicted transcriptional regulator